ncbi:hypothetical protein Patl1_11341 [Pistacia atlantica]|uniref:Uncharacterized protein n=1 Tax=Pistacia atlantica TaxID=434234 RepID=A0ACC1A9G2_9ROSI|nr:hypothetical protein Patl1_11341 [Pistacia atlantica]
MKFLTGFTTKMPIDEVRVDIPLENDELHKKKDKTVTSLEEHNVRDTTIASQDEPFAQEKIKKTFPPQDQAGGV